MYHEYIIYFKNGTMTVNYVSGLQKQYFPKWASPLLEQSLILALAKRVLMITTKVILRIM